MFDIILLTPDSSNLSLLVVAQILVSLWCGTTLTPLRYLCQWTAACSLESNRRSPHSGHSGSIPHRRKYNTYHFFVKYDCVEEWYIPKSRWDPGAPQRSGLGTGTAIPVFLSHPDKIILEKSLTEYKMFGLFGDSRHSHGCRQMHECGHHFYM